MTIVGLSDRRSKHFYYAERGGGGKFCAAIRKYGRDAFEFSVLGKYQTIDECKHAERAYIASLAPNYNLTVGGEGVWGLRHSPESKARMSAAKRGRSGHPCPEWLKKRNSELRKAEYAAGRKRGVHVARLVECVEDGFIFDSATSAAAWYGSNQGNIQRSARSGAPIKSGYHFRYIGA